MIYNCFTRTMIKGDDYPALEINWKQQCHGRGYYGEAFVWADKNRRGPEFSVTISMTMPVGSISVIFEPCKGSCWRCASIEGVDITVRDLQWATIWAAQAIREHQRFVEWVEKIEKEKKN